ncbi:MAG: tRNA pseudouridine(38-40) synthase TruA [Clostridium sp.]|uniref:tRNA pseudouridine(38-40) synthase TruA n=1 Tax=Clostridium sp. TaxID=1506 RepID=UPI002FC9B876
MRNIKLVIEYDGSNYCGWQKQKNAVTVEETLEKVIIDLVKEDIKIIGSSRTDSGVHARGQVACFKTNSSIPAFKFASAITAKLPRDIAVVSSEEVDMDFHPRFSSKGKRYSYNILNRRINAALMRNYYAHVGYELEIDKMVEACNYFIGVHDFSAFKSQGGSTLDSVREIYSLNITKNGDYITMVVEGNGFLYNMVRIIAGTLIDVGRGRIPVNTVGDIIKSKDRALAGKTALACGLCLEEVYY